MLDNYFKALMHVFEKSFKDEVPIFFQTVGFGAVANALPAVFDLCIKHYKAFRVEDATRLLKLIADFDFQSWRQMGTGTAAENSAGDEFRQRLIARLQDAGEEAATTIRL